MDSNANHLQTEGMAFTFQQTPRLVSELNGLDQAAFTAFLGGIVEHSSWVAERAWAGAPFASLEALCSAFATCIGSAGRSEQLALLRTHPELAGREAVLGTLTPDSSAEQSRLGLMALSTSTLTRLTGLNQAYQARFGYPFIAALRMHETLESVLLFGEQRLSHDPDAEWPIALQQVCEVMRGRMTKLVLDAP